MSGSASASLRHTRVFIVARAIDRLGFLRCAGLTCVDPRMSGAMDGRTGRNCDGHTAYSTTRKSFGDAHRSEGSSAFIANSKASFERKVTSFDSLAVSYGGCASEHKNKMKVPMQSGCRMHDRVAIVSGSGLTTRACGSRPSQRSRACNRLRSHARSSTALRRA
jgi:hypothetical protein